MSRTEWVIALATVGFLAEVAGVGLIVLDIRDSRRQGRRIVERGQRHRIEQVVEYDQPPPMSAVGGQQPSLDERITLLEGRHQELVDGLGAVRRELRADATERARHVEEIIRGDYAVLKDVLGDMLAGSLGRRIWGVVLVVFGVAASWAADVVSASASM
jgi:hypothetical protein